MLAILFYVPLDALRHLGLDPVIEWQGPFDHVGGDEGGEYRHRDDDGVEVGVDDVETGAEAGDDERELAYLAEAEAALYGRAQGLAAQQHAGGGGGGLEEDDAEGDDQYGQPLLPQHGGLDEHAYRYEEDRAE